MNTEYTYVKKAKRYNPPKRFKPNNLYPADRCTSYTAKQHIQYTKDPLENQIIRASHAQIDSKYKYARGYPLTLRELSYLYSGKKITLRTASFLGGRTDYPKHDAEWQFLFREQKSTVRVFDGIAGVEVVQRGKVLLSIEHIENVFSTYRLAQNEAGKPCAIIYTTFAAGQQCFSISYIHDYAKPVPDHPHLMVTQHSGQVFSLANKGKLTMLPMTHTLSGNYGGDYPAITGNKDFVKVHRLVAQTWCLHSKRRPDCNVVNHIDENRYNNDSDNLEYGTDTYNNHYSKIAKYVRQHCKQFHLPEDYHALSTNAWKTADGFITLEAGKAELLEAMKNKYDEV